MRKISIARRLVDHQIGKPKNIQFNGIRILVEKSTGGGRKLSKTLSIQRSIRYGLPLRNSSGPRRNVPRVVGKFVEWRLRNVPFWTRRPLFHSACFRATKFTGMAYLEFAAIEINVSYNTRASPLSNDIVHDTVVSLRDIRRRVDAYSFWMNSLHDGRWQAWFSGIFERLNVKVFF